MPLNDTLDQTHLALLQAAAKRADHLLTAPDDLKSRDAKALAKTLIASGFATEVSVAADQPSWWPAAGEAMGLRLTPAGLDEIEQASEELPKQRRQTKRALVIGLLERAEGATLDELMAATGWLAHSTRAALTSLRKSGYALDRLRDEAGHTRYRIGDAASTGATDTAAEAA